jgi:hypothetical protein
LKNVKNRDFYSRNLYEISEKVKLGKVCWSVKPYGVLKNLLFVRELSSRSRSAGDFSPPKAGNPGDPHESGSGILPRLWRGILVTIPEPT